jgi:hypothetical protein
LDETAGAYLDEQINTEHAFHVVDKALTGVRRSLRRWLFFRGGHSLVMNRATRNIATLLNREIR